MLSGHRRNDPGRRAVHDRRLIESARPPTNGASPGALRMLFVYTATVFLRAFLLFLVQPLIAKQILPWFGASAADWTTRMVFFQSGLLAGYAYADAFVRTPKPAIQSWTHVVLLVASLVMLPVVPAVAWRPLGTRFIYRRHPPYRTQLPWGGERARFGRGRSVALAPPWRDPARRPVPVAGVPAPPAEPVLLESERDRQCDRQARSPGADWRMRNPEADPGLTLWTDDFNNPFHALK